jgi:hypothetical protein
MSSAKVFTRNEFSSRRKPYEPAQAVFERSKYNMVTPRRYQRQPGPELSKAELRQLLTQAVNNTGK